MKSDGVTQGRKAADIIDIASTIRVVLHLSVATIPLPLDLHASCSTLLRLTSVRPPTLLLVSSHTSTELNVHPGRSGETERLRDLDEVDLVDIKN